MSSSRGLKKDTAVRTASWPRFNMTVHQKFRNIAFQCPFTNAYEKLSLCHWIMKNMDKPYDWPSRVGIVWGRRHGRIFPINIQYQFRWTQRANRKKFINVKRNFKQKSSARSYFRLKNNSYGLMDETGKSSPTWKWTFDTHIFIKFIDVGKQILIYMIYRTL